MFKVTNLLFFLLLITTGIQRLKAQDIKKLSLSLEDLFRMADENNRALKVLSYNEQLAEEDVLQQKNKLLPSIDASFSFSYNGDGWLSDRDFSHGMHAAIPDFGNNFALEAAQVIYGGGAIKTYVQISKLNLLLARLDKDKNRAEIRFLIAGYYLELQKVQNQRDILQRNLVQTDKMLQQIQNKLKQGTVLRNAVTRYELQRQSLELSLIKLNNAEKIINNELVKTLQLPQGTILGVGISPELDAIPRDSSVEWQELAAQTSPVLKQMKFQMLQAKRQERLIQSDKLPKLFLFAADRFDGPIMVEVPPLDKNLNYWYAGVGIKYNIASLYKSKSQIRAAMIVTQRATENTAMAKEQLANDIEAASIRLKEAQNVYKTQLKAVQLSTENYHVMRTRYMNNLVLMTELLDAENARIDAELHATNARIAILFQYYQLKKLSGTI